MASHSNINRAKEELDSQTVECPEPVEGLSFLYILLCHNGTFYVGQTTDVRSRLRRHENGHGARHTAMLCPFQFVYVEGPMEPTQARRREVQLKKWSAAKKRALIEGNLDALRELSKSREKDASLGKTG